MNAVLRHIGLRLWLTVFLGGALCLIWLPSWQTPFGVGWLWLPAALTLAAVFLAGGWLMNRTGRILLQRQMREAAVWERAGHHRQARRTYERVAALCDSFWLSPLQRRHISAPAAAQTARFLVAQGELNLGDRKVLAAYFLQHPGDARPAERWLEHLLEHDFQDQREQEAAGRIGERLADHLPIQRLLLRFYLAVGRTDFSAIQTYRYVWRENGALPPEETIAMARLLLNESLLNDWTLAVFMAGYVAGAPECLTGLRAAVRLLPPNSDNRDDLQAARAICAAAKTGDSITPTPPPLPPPISYEQPVPYAAPPVTAKAGIAATEPIWRFEVGPLGEEPVDEPSWISAAYGRRRRDWPDIPWRRFGNQLKQAWAGAGRRLQGGLADGVARIKDRPNLLAMLRKTVIAAGLLATVVVVLFAGLRWFGTRPAPVAVPPAPSAPSVVNDPFTIQVAAFLHAEDASRFVERLKQNGLNAFSTEALSANRKWFQVKISHFATRAQAQTYGTQLKSKGLIDDFYVANFNPGDDAAAP